MLATDMRLVILTLAFVTDPVNVISRPNVNLMSVRS